MKRSEAVEEIRKILAMNGKDNGEGELEEAILHHLEVLGMLPPSYRVDYGPLITANAWEPEKFDAKGNLVGSSTDCAKSHRRKK